MNCSKLNSISYHAQSSPIVSLHRILSPTPFPISQVAPRPRIGENVNIPVDRSERQMYNKRTQYISVACTHALLKKVGGGGGGGGGPWPGQEIAEKFTKRMEFLAISGSA